jgi:hypothetical protein
MSSKNLPVSINVFPTLDFVELVQFNEKSGEIEKAAALPCAFDPATRQMMDRDQFTQTIRDLYNVSRIAMATPAVLVLPGFYTREIDLPAEFSREELRFALVSEAERFYAFKKVEPVVDWVKVDKDRLLYSAFAKGEIEKYTRVFQELHLPLIAIDLSYFSIIRGLLTTGILGNDIVTKGESWCLLAISDNAMFAASMKGLRIQKTIDVRLSVIANEDNGVIQEIQQDFLEFNEEQEFTKVCLINNANSLESQKILLALGLTSDLVLVEQNASTLGSRGALNPLYPCSLEAVGGIFHRRFPDLLGMNFLPQSNADIAVISRYQAITVNWLLGINAAIFVLAMLIWGVMGLLLWQKDQETQALSVQAQHLDINGDSNRMTEIERQRFVKYAVDRNVGLNNLLVSLGGALPTDTWLERIQINSENLHVPWDVILEGKTLHLDAVNALVPVLNAQSPNAPLQISTAAQAVSNEGQSYFTWSIRNKSAQAESNTSGGSP